MPGGRVRGRADRGSARSPTPRSAPRERLLLRCAPARYSGIGSDPDAAALGGVYRAVGDRDGLDRGTSVARVDLSRVRAHGWLTGRFLRRVPQSRGVLRTWEVFTVDIHGATLLEDADEFETDRGHGAAVNHPARAGAPRAAADLVRACARSPCQRGRRRTSSARLASSGTMPSSRPAWILDESWWAWSSRIWLADRGDDHFFVGW